MKDDKSVTLDNSTGKVITPPQRYRCKLQTAADCRKQMARIFRESRSGLIDVQEAAKLTWILSSIANTIKINEFELRLLAIEQSAGENNE